jgi:hypothetical protein
MPKKYRYSPSQAFFYTHLVPRSICRPEKQPEIDKQTTGAKKRRRGIRAKSAVPPVIQGGFP